MPRFASGVVRFQNDVFPKKRELFERLSKGQSPEAMFITCSDSRIETAMLTQTEPGDLFVCRNAGNIVPPHTSQTGGMTASIEFAVAVLKVPHIVVCGHTECGAMKGAMHVEDLQTLPHVRQWLGYTKAAVDVVSHLGAGCSDADRMTMLIEQNVVLQLNHLRTHPTVAAGIASGRLQLHGWIYDIGSGDVAAYDDARRHFVSVPTYYADALTQHGVGQHSCAAPAHRCEPQAA